MFLCVKKSPYAKNLFLNNACASDPRGAFTYCTEKRANSPLLTDGIRIFNLFAAVKEGSSKNRLIDFWAQNLLSDAATSAPARGSAVMQRDLISRFVWSQTGNSINESTTRGTPPS